MIQAETKIRVRYGETDRMGYAYYGVYAQYYEVGRVETMRKLGFSYRDIEDRGILMPVVDFNISYKKAALYDEEITIVTTLRERPGPLKLTFEYTCTNAEGELLNSGRVVLVSVDKETGKPRRLPDWFESAVDRFFKG